MRLCFSKTGQKQVEGLPETLSGFLLSVLRLQEGLTPPTPPDTGFPTARVQEPTSVPLVIPCGHRALSATTLPAFPQPTPAAPPVSPACFPFFS